MNRYVFNAPLGGRLALLLILGGVAIVTACRGERAIREEIELSDRAALLTDATFLHRKYIARADRDERVDQEIPVSEWPTSFRRFQPKRIWIDSRGVYICTHERYVETAGVFIRVDPTYEPPLSGDPGFELIEGDFFWFYAPG